MVNADLVAVKLSELSDRAERIRSVCPPDAEQLARDRTALELVSFNLMLAVQSCLDVASHIIADEGWRSAATLAESFTRLRDHGVLQSRTAERLAQASGLRNVIAHGYARVNPQFIFSGATEGLHDVDAFAREVSAWIEQQRSP